MKGLAQKHTALWEKSTKSYMYEKKSALAPRYILQTYHEN